MNTDCAVCYVSSVDYLLPSIISALGVRRYISQNKASIFIFASSSDEDLSGKLNAYLRSEGITIINFHKDALSQIEEEKIEGYISPTTFGRFHIADLLPLKCRRLVYIDGDTWIRQDITTLIETEVPDGRIAAAEDVISFRCKEQSEAGHRIQKYLNGLGVNPQTGYFNSGVLAVATKTWRTLSSDALAFFKQHRQLCDCLDQSALNAVTGDRRLKVSLRWNFQSPARFLGAEGYISPAIYHFNQYVKPWMGRCKPWTEMYEPYIAAMEPLKTLNLNIPMIPQEEITKHNKMTLTKNALLEMPQLARLLPTYRSVRSYEQSAWI